MKRLLAINLVFNGLSLAALAIFLAWLFTKGVNAFESITTFEDVLTLIKNQPQLLSSATLFVFFGFINLITSIVMIGQLDRVREGKSLVIMVSVLSLLGLIPFAIILNAISYFSLVEYQYVYRDEHATANTHQPIKEPHVTHSTPPSAPSDKASSEQFITFPHPLPPVSKSVTINEGSSKVVVTTSTEVKSVSDDDGIVSETNKPAK